MSKLVEITAPHNKDKISIRTFLDQNMNKTMQTLGTKITLTQHEWKDDSLRCTSKVPGTTVIPQMTVSNHGVTIKFPVSLLLSPFLKTVIAKMQSELQKIIKRA